MTNGNDSAFGKNVIRTFGNHIDGTTAAATETVGGLTKREYFAAMAMQGLLGCGEDTPTWGGQTAKEAGEYLGLADNEYSYSEHYPLLIVKSAVAYADALINELNKENQR